MHPTLPNTTGSSDKDDWYKKKTEIVTKIALFLSFIIGIPVILGAIGSAITSFFTDEDFLSGEYTVGIFLLIASMAVYFFYFVFLRGIRRQVWHIIEPPQITKDLGSMLVVLFFPMLVVSGLFYLIGMLQHYQSYQWAFQFPIVIGFQLIGLGLLRFWNLPEPIPSSETSDALRSNQEIEFHDITPDSSPNENLKQADTSFNLEEIQTPKKRIKRSQKKKAPVSNEEIQDLAQRMTKTSRESQNDAHSKSTESLDEALPHETSDSVPIDEVVKPRKKSTKKSSKKSTKSTGKKSTKPNLSAQGTLSEKDQTEIDSNAEKLSAQEKLSNTKKGDIPDKSQNPEYTASTSPESQIKSNPINNIISIEDPLKQAFYKPLTGESLFRIFFLIILIKIVCETVALAISESIGSWILINGFTWLLLTGVVVLLSRQSSIPKPALPEIVVIILRSLFMIPTILFLVITLYSDTINLFLYILIIIAFLYKMVYGMTFLAASPVFTTYKIPISWNRIVRINEILTVVVYLMIYIAFIVVTPESWIIMIIAVVFLVDLFIERRLQLISLRFTSIFFPANLVIIAALFSFVVLPISPVAGLIIFTFLLTFIANMVTKEGLISQKVNIFIQNAIYTALFFEIGIFFAILTAENLLFISDSVVFNYFFFIVLASLSSLYRLWWVQFNKQPNRILNRLIIGHLYFIFFGIALIFQDILVSGWEQLVPVIQSNVNMGYLLRPSILLAPMTEGIAGIYTWIGSLQASLPFFFKSDDGYASILTMLSAASIGVLLLAFAMNIHKELKIVSIRTIMMHELVHRCCVAVLVVVWPIILLQSLTGILIGITFGTIVLLLILETAYNLKLVPEVQYFQWTGKLFIINLGESLFIWLFLSIEVFLVNFSTALIIAISALLCYQNFIPRVKQKIKSTTLHLINAFLIISLAALVIPSLIFLLETYTNFQVSDYLLITVLTATLILLLALKIAIRELYNGKFLVGFRWTWVNFGVSLLITVFCYIIIVYWGYVGLITTDLKAAGINSAAAVIVVVFSPILGIAGIGKFFKNRLQEVDPQQAKWCGYVAFIAWVLPSLLLPIALMIQTDFSFFFIILGLLIIGICAIVPMNDIKAALPFIAIRVDQIREILLEVILGLILVDVFVLCTEFITMPWPWALICALSLLLVFIYTVPIYKHHLNAKARILITVIVIFGDSWLIAGMLFVLPQLSLPAILSILLIPTTIAFVCMHLLSHGVIEQPRVFQGNQIIAVTFFGLIITTIFTASLPALGFLWAFSISSFTLTGLLIYDRSDHRFLTVDRYVLTIAFTLLLTDLIVGSLLIISVIPFLEYQIMGFFLIVIPGLNAIIDQSIIWRQELIETPETSEISTPTSHIPSAKPGAIQEQPYPVPQSVSPSLKVRYPFFYQLEQKAPQIKQGFMGGLLAILMAHILIVCLSSPAAWSLSLLFLGTFIMAMFASMEMQKYNLKAMYIQSLVALLFLLFIRSDVTNYIISNIWLVGKEFLIIIQIIIACINNRLSTKIRPLTPIIRNIMILCTISMYCLILSGLGFEYFIILMLAAFLYHIFSYPSFKNITSRSVLLWATMLALANLLFEIPDLSLFVIIGLPFAIGFTMQWILFQRDTAWHQTFVKKSIGWGAIYAWLVTYIALMILYAMIFQPLAPFILIVLVAVLNKLKPNLPHREQLFNIITLFSVVAITYTFSASYFFFALRYKAILAISLSFAVFGFTFLYLFRKLEMTFSKEIIVANLLAGTVFSGIFSYFFLIDPEFINCPWQIAFSIAADLTVIAFFMAIGVYRHDFTKNIWTIGWPIWNLIPIVNFFMISFVISGMDYFTNAWMILNTELHGSLLFTILICSIMYLPVLTYKFKHQMYKIIYVFWFELLAIAAWTAVNIFPTNPSIQGVFVAFVALLILVPIFYHYGLSQFLTLIWFPLGIMNIIFLTLLLQLPLQWQIPVDILLAGFYVLACGYFRYVRQHFEKIGYGLIVSGYLLIYGSIFALLYSFMVILFIDPMIAFNITAIIMAFGLLSSKYIEFDEYIVKNILSGISIINIGMLVGRTFSLIPNFLVMGIFLGIAFSAGTTLAFQARKFLPPFLHEIIWLLMAICFGLSIAELILTILGIGWWAAIGSFIIITGLIAYPLYKKHAIIAPSCILGLAMWIMEGLLLIPGIETVNPALLFLIVALGCELIYIYGARNTSWVFGRDEKQTLEIFVSIWVIYAFLIATLTIQLILIGIQLDWINIILLFTLIGAFLNVVSGKLTIKYDLFNHYPKTHRIVEISRNIIILIAYINSALLLALNIPLLGDTASLPNLLGFEIAFRIAIFSGILFLETFLVDERFIGLIRTTIRSQLKMFCYATSSFCIFLMIGFGTNYWSWATLTIAILSFGTIRLNVMAGNRVYPEITKFCNVIIIAITLFIGFWPIFNTSNTLISLYIGPLMLNLCVCFSVIYLFMRLKIIDYRFQTPVFIACTIFLTLTIAEYLRQFISINPLIYSGIVVLILALSNIKTIPRKAILIYGFWTGIAYAIGACLSELIYFLNDYQFSVGDSVLVFFVCFGIVNSLLYLALAKRYFMMDSLEKPTDLLIVGYENPSNARKIFALWTFIEAIIVSIAFTRVWVYASGLILTEFQIDIIRQILVWLTLIPLVFFAQLSAIFHYIRRYELWQENPKLVPVITQARNIIALLTYGLLPTFITINSHYGMINLIPLEYTILLDILIFASVFFVDVALLDMKRLRLIDIPLATKMSIGSVLVIGASLAIMFFLGTGYIFGACIIFSSVCYILKFFLSPEIFSRVFFIVNLSLYIEILGQLTWIFFEFIPWLWALFLTTLIFHIMMEIEVRMAFLPPFKPWVKSVRQYSWLAFTTASALSVLLFQLPTFSVWHVFAALLVIFLELLYFNKLLNTERPIQYQYWYEFIGQAIYFDILAVLAALLIPLSIDIVGSNMGFILLAQFGIYCGLCFIAYLLLKFDFKYPKFIPEHRLHQLNIGVYILGMSFIAIELWLLIFNIMELFNSGDSINILVAFLGTTVYLSLVFHRRFRNRIVDQLFYTLTAFEILGLFYAFNYVTIMIIAAFVALLLYPFIFFMELMQKLFWAIINGLKQLITNFVKFIQQIFTKIRDWFVHNQKSIVYLISASISIILLIWLKNPFLMIMVFLVTIYKYSPEHEHETTAQNFKKKVLYRGALYGSLIGTALWYLGSYLISNPWLIPLAILVFLGYLIWVVRNSEQLYQLPIQWRFWSATLTIIDAIVLVILLVV